MVVLVLLFAGGCGGTEDESSGGGQSPDAPVGSDPVAPDPGVGPPDLGPVDEPTLAIPADEVAPGGRVTAYVIAADRRLTYGACPTVEVLDPSGEWQPAITEPMACIEIAYVTQPGRTGGALTAGVPPDAEPGEYRLRHQVTVQGEGPGVETATLTAPFTVTA